MASSKGPILSPAPWADTVTAYDEAHVSIYLRLLDALDAGASRNEMQDEILQLHSDMDAAVATDILDSHIARARWMRDTGYQSLLSG